MLRARLDEGRATLGLALLDLGCWVAPRRLAVLTDEQLGRAWVSLDAGAENGHRWRRGVRGDVLSVLAFDWGDFKALRAAEAIGAFVRSVCPWWMFVHVGLDTGPGSFSLAEELRRAEVQRFREDIFRAFVAGAGTHGSFALPSADERYGWVGEAPRMELLDDPPVGVLREKSPEGEPVTVEINHTMNVPPREAVERHVRDAIIPTLNERLLAHHPLDIMERILRGEFVPSDDSEDAREIDAMWENETATYEPMWVEGDDDAT